MKYKPTFTLCCLAAILMAARPATAQHGHLNVGAEGTSQDDALVWANGDLFVTNSGYVVSLEHTNAGRFAGFYQGSITFTALPATPLTGGPAFGHAALGSFLELEMRSAAGPPGGEFGFWESADLEPRLTIEVGAFDQTNRFALSEGDGSAGSDPFGHIHGRVFSATEPGLYAIGFRILDTSRNGVGSGPIHVPSEPFHLFFQAGLVADVADWATNAFSVTFGARVGLSYSLESAPRLAASNRWTVVAGPIVGNNRLQTLTDLNATNRAGFYRLRRDPP